MKPEVALKQLDAELAQPGDKGGGGQPGDKTVGGEEGGGPEVGSGPSTPPAAPKPRRYHGTVSLDPTRVGRDAGRIADEVIAHLAGLVGSTVTVTLEIEAAIPAGAPDQVVRVVTENGRTLKFVEPRIRGGMSNLRKLRKECPR